MSSTREVSQPERSRDRSDEQPENIPPAYTPPIRVTPEVSQPERSRDRSEAQPENMPLMSVTREVSRPERSRASTVRRTPKR